MVEHTNNKTIAKNTVLLYVRLAFSMFVALFTSRVILRVLGVTDMGINATVAGVVGFAGFLNAALSNGTSRFLTYSLGKGETEEMRRTFSTTFWVHAGLAIMVAILVEIVGLWFLYNKLIIPPERMEAAVWVFHLSVITMVVGMTQVPYGACVIAHEKMNMYAYTGIIDVVLKLIIVYLLTIFEFDKLKLYSLLFFIVSMGMMLFYRWYCMKNFEECKLSFSFDKAIFKPIAEFSGWQLFAQTAIALNGQGILILLNMFFSPAVVAARAISLQVNNVASQFMTNFRNAANPQIVKKYAAKDYEGSKKLLIQSTVFSYYLMWLMSLPICLLSYKLLYFWLGQVPEYSDIFLSLVVIQGLFQIFDTGLYTALYAKGRIKENALSSPTIGFCAFPLVYILFRQGYSPVALSWVFIGVYAILGLILKPILLVKIVGYHWSDFPKIYVPCLKVTICSLPLPLLVHYYENRLFTHSIISFMVQVIVCVISILVSIWMVGLTDGIKEKLIKEIKRRLHK